MLGCAETPDPHPAISLPRELKVYTESEAVTPALKAKEPKRAAREDDAFPPGLLSPPPQEFPRPPTSLSPYHPYTHQTVRAPDGRLTRLYWIRAGNGAVIEPLVRAHTRAGDPAVAVVTMTAGVQVDPRPSKPVTTLPNNELATLIPGVEKVSDLLAVTSSEDVLLEVDDFLTTVLTEIPQIEIEATVVEVTFDDNVDVGVNLSVDEQKPHFKKDSAGNTIPNGEGNDNDTLFSQFNSPLDPASFLAGNNVGSLALSFFQDDIRYHAVLRAIQASSNTEVLSAPKMAVLNGHRAVIDTGSKTPVLQPVLGTAGNLQQVQVRFEDTGVKLIVTPYVLMDDIIQVDITAEVSFVSGFIESGATGILNPIISQRTASTVVNVRDGQPFAIGGLKATNSIERVNKVPVLGDIPLLGYLFKNNSVEQRQSKVFFFVKPTLFRQPPPLFEPGD